MASLSGERCEPRVAMMALAKVTWEDATGASYAASVTIEDTSSYGACIRTRAPITIGSRLKVDWRGGRFSGVAKYCRQYREDFIVGIQRDVREGSLLPSPSSPAPLGGRPATTLIKAAPPPESRPRLQSALGSPIKLQPPASPPIPVRQDAGAARPESRDRVPAPPAAPQLPAPGGIPADQSSAREAKTSMLTKWLRRDPKPESKAAPASRTPSAPDSHDGKRPGPDSSAPRFSPQNRPALAAPVAPSALLPLDDIYRAKGIIGLRMGYNINKVVDMLNSDHARDLPGEMKRASVLMALDAAGVPLDDVLRDAAQRLDALNTYEADQEKQLAEYEARKVQENAEIQAEMERVSAHYLERLKRNMDEVTQMRAPFASWQALKQQEAQKITEAVDLCTKPAQDALTDAASAVPSDAAAS